MPNTDWKQVCAACAEGTPPERCAYYGDPNGCNAPTLGKHPEGNLAERLQEALEKAERRIAELERAPGNAAALREALEKCAELGDQIDNWLGSDEATVWNCRNERSAAHNIMLTARAALAAPARNCDKYGIDDIKKIDADFGAFCQQYGAKDGENCVGCPIKPMDNLCCHSAWMLLAAEGGAE